MRLIDADAKELNQRITISFGAVTRFIVKSILKDAPTIDAVPVVRCKDCKHGEVDDPDYFPDQYYCHEGCGWHKGDFFCSYGERRDGDT